MQQAARVSDTTAFFYLGTMVEIGATRQIFTAPRRADRGVHHRTVRMTAVRTQAAPAPPADPRPRDRPSEAAARLPSRYGLRFWYGKRQILQTSTSRFRGRR